jgi:pilus assembly protein CpaB
MGAARIFIIAVAFVAAIGLAVVVRSMMIGKPTKAVPLAVAEASVPTIPMVRVLVAKRDLVVGTRVSADDMTWQSMPKDGLNPAYITDGQVAAPLPTTTKAKVEKGAAQVVASAIGGSPSGMQNLIDSVVHENISAGEPILANKLIRIGEGGYLSAMLQPGMRAIAVPVTAENGAGGFILPGDHVDVVWVHDQDTKSGKTRKVSEVVVTNVRVLAIDQKTKPDADAQAIVGAAATLEVAPDAADALLAAGADGKLQLSLRSYADARAPSGRVAARAAAAPPVVRLFEDGKVTEFEVNR